MRGEPAPGHLRSHHSTEYIDPTAHLYTPAGTASHAQRSEAASEQNDKARGFKLYIAIPETQYTARAKLC